MQHGDLLGSAVRPRPRPHSHPVLSSRPRPHCENCSGPKSPVLTLLPNVSRNQRQLLRRIEASTRQGNLMMSMRQHQDQWKVRIERERNDNTIGAIGVHCAEPQIGRRLISCTLLLGEYLSYPPPQLLLASITFRKVIPILLKRDFIALQVDTLCVNGNVLVAELVTCV
jgi:hypothetical protein